MLTEKRDAYDKSGLLKWFGLLSVLLSMTAVAGVRDQLVVTDGETLQSTRCTGALYHPNDNPGLQS